MLSAYKQLGTGKIFEAVDVNNLPEGDYIPLGKVIHIGKSGKKIAEINAELGYNELAKDVV